MAYKFQLGSAIVSGSLTRDAGNLTIRAHDNSTKITLDTAGDIDAAGSVTAGSSFIIGSADLNETDMEKLDGITNGAVAANKAVVVDASKDADGFRNITGTGDLTMGTVTMTGFSVDADGDLVAKSVVGTTTVRATTELSGATLSIGGGDVTISDAGAISGSSNLSLAGNISASFGKILSDNNGALYATDFSASVDLLASQDVNVSRDAIAGRDVSAGRNLLVGGVTLLQQCLHFHLQVILKLLALLS